MGENFIDDLVKSMTLAELRAAQDDFVEKGILDAGEISPIDQARREAMSSTMEGESDPEPGTTSLDSVEMSGWGRNRRNQLEYEARSAEPKCTNERHKNPGHQLNQDCGEEVRRYLQLQQVTRKAAQIDAEKAANLSRNGYDPHGRPLDREIDVRQRFYQQASDDNLAWVALENQRIRAACPGVPPCEVDHDVLTPDDFVKHIEGTA